MAHDIVTLTMAMLSEDFLYFDKGDIAWNGETHSFKSFQVNAPTMDDLLLTLSEVGFDGIDDYYPNFLGALMRLESDEKLVVARSKIAKGICRALPKGDLTGITLANLASCGAAIRILRQDDGGADGYTVIYDTRLALGIPQFFSLIERMVWDLRACTTASMGKPFAILFLSCRNFDANHYFGKVDSPVPGMQVNPGLTLIDCAPEINLCGNPFGLAEATELEGESALDVENPEKQGEAR